MKKFVDNIDLNLKAGNGGNGLASFFQDWRQKHARPDGGDGGNGGAIIFEASNSINSLDHFQKNQTLFSLPGANGKPKKKDGANAPDAIFFVPVGTLIFNADKSQLLFDLSTPGQKYWASKGGKGGLGNTHFLNSSQYPLTHSEPGAIGVHKRVHLELKLIAKIGLIGLPNAGKSSLLKKLTAANPDVADYEFTTLIPNLGVLKKLQKEPLTIADLPGLIRGAAQNKGLGNRFLKHAERCSVLLHLVDFAVDSSSKIKENIKIIAQELIEYNAFFKNIPQIIVANKIDLSIGKENFQKFNFSKISSLPAFSISAKNGEGFLPLINWLFNYFALNQNLQTVISYELAESKTAIPVYTPDFEEEIRLRKLRPNTWELAGKFVNDLSKKFHKDPDAGLKQINAFFARPQVIIRLENEGVKKNDVIFVLGSQFTWFPE